MRFFLCALILVSTYFLYAQEPVSVHLTEKDNLPDTEFYNILEDKKGFIWLCADKGLFRYDGKNYKTFTNPDKRGLSVFEPFEDHLGRVWVNNISGQFFYVSNTELVTFIDLKNQLNGDLANFIVTKDYLIVTAYSNIYRVNLNTKAVELIVESQFPISKLQKVEDGFFAFTNDTFYAFSPDFNKITKRPLIYNNKIKGKIEGVPGVVKFKDRYIVSFSIKEQSQFFVLDANSANLQKLKGLDFLNNQRISTLKVLHEHLWIATSSGAYKIGLKNNRFYNEEHLLPSEYISGFLVDKDFNYWVLTLSNSIYIIPNIELKKYYLPDNLSRINCEVKANDSLIFLGTKNGYFIKLNTISGNYAEQQVSNSQISAMYYNSAVNKGILSSDISNYLIETSTLKPIKERFFSSAKSFSKIDNNTVAFCNYNKVSLYNFNTNEIQDISSGKRAYTTYYDVSTAILYIGFLDNLVAYKDGKKFSITDNGKIIFTTSIAQTANGVLWVSTFKNGIYAIEHNKVVAHYTTKNGLKSNQIEYLKADHNKLWIATSQGLQNYNISTNTFKTLQKTDGIPSYQITGMQIDGDTVLCTSNKGVFTFNKQKVFKKKATPKVYFNKIKINNQPKAISKNYELDYDQNAMEIGFNINGYSYNDNYSYQYRLLGYSENWVTTNTNENFVKYNSLPSGNYKFQIKPLDALKSSITSLDIKIKLPFWQTWWFLLISILVFLVIIWLVFRVLINKKEKQRIAQVKQLSIDNELITLKLENLRSQMNPHFIFNALNSIQEYIILNQKDLASDYLSKFALLIRTYLDHSSKGNVSLGDEIECLKMYLELEKMRFEDKLFYKITTDDSLNNFEIKIPTMLIQPYVENAIKHGLLHRDDDRQLNINFSLNSKQNLVKCTVIDNGMGRAFSANYKSRNHKKHKSFATQANSDRLKLLNYSKEKQIGVEIIDLYDNKQPIGTKVIISIPYNIQ